jgi:hypothetical protein
VLQTLGGTYIAESDPSTATILAIESLRIATAPDVNDLLSTVEGVRQVALSQSISGDHKRALAGFEKLFPLVRAIGKYYPAAYYDFLNGLAVELCEVGRVGEAETAVALAVASPFAPAFPEWTETRDEIAAKRKSASPSVVAINRALKADCAPQAEPQRKPTPLRPFGFSCPARRRDSFQRSIITIPARTTTTAFNAVSILDRVLIRIGPRAPPALS